MAIRQHGNVTHAQLTALGLTRPAIARRVRNGRLYRSYPGVYVVGRPPSTPLERASAAVLACGPGAALSHASAMTLWGFWTRWDVPFEVSVTRDRRPPHITVHRPTTLTRHDIRIHLGIRTTSPARTLLDIAARLTERQLNRAVKNALVSPYMNEHHLTDLITRHPTHPATRRLAPFTTIPAHRYRSGFEIDFPSFCKDWNLPEPLINARVAGYTVDAYFPHHNVIVELDGRAYHLNPVSFETDRDRDADTLKAGNVTVRITEQRMTQTPRQEADRLRAILDARRPR